MRLNSALLLIAVAVVCVCVTASPRHSHKVTHTFTHSPSSSSSSSRLHRHHIAPSRDLEELDQQLTVEYTDKNNLPGIASTVSWIGSPSKGYDIFVGDFENLESWKLVEGDAVLQNHPTVAAADAPEKPKKISKSLSSSSDKFLEVSLEGANPAKNVIVCEAGEKKVCGFAKLEDKYDTADWWTVNDAPRAIFIPFLRKDGTLYSGGKFQKSCVDSDQFRGVLHTTETTGFTPSTTSYYGHTSSPHFTVHFKDGKARTYQHLPLSVAARALKNAAGGVQTNTQCAIQIEIATRAASSASMPAEQKEELKQLIGWISTQKNIPFESAEYFGAKDVKRFPNDMWETFHGWCGHQHIPENDHWDPGMIGQGPSDANPIDWATSTLYTELGLKITHCHSDSQWTECNKLASLEQDEE